MRVALQPAAASEPTLRHEEDSRRKARAEIHEKVFSPFVLRQPAKNRQKANQRVEEVLAAQARQAIASNTRSKPKYRIISVFY